MSRWWTSSLFVLAVLTVHVSGLHAAQQVETVTELPSVELQGGLSRARATEVFLKANLAYK